MDMWLLIHVVINGDLYDLFIHILQGGFTGTEAIVSLP